MSVGFKTEASGLTKPEIFAPATVSLSGDVINLDAETYNFFDIYLDRPMTRINLPTNPINGFTYRVQVRQDMTGGRFLKWGNLDSFTSLNASIEQGVGEIVVTVHSGTFDWTTLRADAGRKSFINIAGFTNNVNNMDSIKLKSFDESAGTITLDACCWDITDELTVAGITVQVESAFYFIDEKGDDWIGQFPFGVTQFTFYTTSDGASVLLVKEGVYSNSAVQRAKVRFEEQLTDDFINGSDNGLLNWREGNANGTTSVSSSDVDGSHIGMLSQNLTSGISGDSRTSTTLGTDMFNVSDMRVGIEGVVKFNENALETADVEYLFGWTDNPVIASAVDGAFFRIIADGSTDGYGRVHCITAIGGVETDYDTGIDLHEDEWHDLLIGLPSNGIGVIFAVESIIVHVADRATMGTTAKLTCGFGSEYDYTTTVLPNTKTWFIDLFSLKYRLNADRI